MYIDAHHHLWHFDSVEYDWIDESMSVLKRDFLVEDLEKLLHRSETDMTIFFRNLADVKKDKSTDWFSLIEDAFYDPKQISGDLKEDWTKWFQRYGERLAVETLSDKARKVEMKKVNPKYVLRNYMAQLAIDAADNGDYSILGELFELLKQPYAEQPDAEKWFAKRPEWARNKVGCSMLSCSS